MKKFLFTTLPSNDLGLLTQSLPIAGELRSRGHHVTFCSPGRAPGAMVSQAGFSNLRSGWPLYSMLAGDTRLINYFRLSTSKHLKRNLGILSSFVGYIKNQSTAKIWNIDHFMYTMGMRDENYFRAAVNALKALIKECQPDAVVDFWNPFACLAARALRRPLITVIQADLHPLSRGFIWWEEPPLGLPTPVAAINTILAENRLPSVNGAAELLVGDMTLVVGMPETDPLPAIAVVTYIGPALGQRQEQELPDWIDDFSAGQPLIWVYPGNPRYLPGSESPFDSMVIIQACIEALKGMPVRVVLSSGYQSLPKTVLPLPSNFRHAAFVPGLAMAKRSDLLIHHGGYGSCQTGLYSGTPAVIIPTYSERESNARRIAACGAGEFVLPSADALGRRKQVNTEGLRAMVGKVLSEPSYRANAGRLSEKLRSYGGASEAARLIDDFIGNLNRAV